MSQLYGDLGATYGTHTNRTYGTLFDPSDVPQTGGFVALFARVARNDVLAEVSNTSIGAQVTTRPVDWSLN